MRRRADCDDRRYLRAAVRLGRRHEGLTADNPSVGCLLIRDGRIVGSGVTGVGGRPHAEIVALGEAGDAARGATAYVSLEPCAHYGRSPPCAEALVRARVSRVVTALRDPFQRVNGLGIAKLREAGVEVAIVSEPTLVAMTRDGMAGFLSRIERKRPYVILKLAVSTEGWLGRAGEEVAITGRVARRYTHLLRARADGIVVGVGTVLADNPSLTCRLPGMAARSPRRYVLDTQLRTPPAAQVVLSAEEIPTTILVGEAVDPERPGASASESADLALDVAPMGDGSDRGISRVLERVFADGVGVLMVEGGASVARSFLDAGVVDEIHLLLGRSIRDDPSAASPIASPILGDQVPSGFQFVRELELGQDRAVVLRRTDV